MMLATLHDLPPKWDGHVVVWDEWAEELPTSLVYHLPLRHFACEKCGSLTRRSGSVGQVGVIPEVTHAQIRRANAARKGGKYGLRRLFASRCADCGHDQVYDMDADELFDLEPCDYGDGGSHDPADIQGALF